MRGLHVCWYEGHEEDCDDVQEGEQLLTRKKVAHKRGLQMYWCEGHEEDCDDVQEDEQLPART